MVKSNFVVAISKKHQRCGLMDSPPQVFKQIEGGTMTGLGYATMEQVQIDDGKVSTANFGEYKIPTIADVPPFKSSVTEQPEGAGPYNSMPIGETANIPTAAAIANAVEDACGVRIKSLPITAEKIYQALHGDKS